MSENERLKILQKEMGYKSQEEFATILGIKQGSLSGIYRKAKGVGVSNPIKRKLSELGVNLGWLATGEGSMFTRDIVVTSGVGAISGAGNHSIVNNIGLDGRHNIIGPDGKVKIIPAPPQNTAEIIADNEALRRENAEKDRRILELKDTIADQKDTIAAQKETIDRLFKMLDSK